MTRTIRVASALVWLGFAISITWPTPAAAQGGRVTLSPPFPVEVVSPVAVVGPVPVALGEHHRHVVRVTITSGGQGALQVVGSFPSGKRFVVEHLAAFTLVPVGFNSRAHILTAADNLLWAAVPLTKQLENVLGDNFQASLPMKVHVDGGQELIVNWQLSGVVPGGQETHLDLALSGYLIDLP